MDECLEILRAYWRDERIDYDGKHYQLEAMAMEPKSPQGERLPIWIGGNVERALKRVGEYGDGWLATAIEDMEIAKRCREKINRFAEAAGRDPSALGMQMMLDVPPRDEAGKQFYAKAENVIRRAALVKEAGFEWGALNATAMFQAGFRSVDAMIDQLGVLHDALRSELGD